MGVAGFCPLAPIRTATYGQGEGSNVSVVLTVPQTGHGFSVLQLVYNNAGTYTLANSAADATLASGLVSRVVDVNTFELAKFGFVTSVAHGKGASGAALYCSDATPGLMSTTATRQMVGEIENADVISINFWPV